MKKIINLSLTAIILFTLKWNLADAQTKIHNIQTIVKVWGFLKYHHPAVAKGPINWDSVFIAHISNAAHAKDNVQLNTEIADLIQAAGPVKKTTIAALPPDVFTLNHNLNWLYNSKVLNQQNKKSLEFIYNNRNQDSTRFIKYNNYSDYSGEHKYADMKMPDEKYRLLFLSRFWNAIEYFAPYKYLIGEDWDNVLKRFIPRIVAASDTLSYYKTLMQLAVSLHDGHSSLLSDDGSVDNVVWGKYTVPVYIEIDGDQVMVRQVGNDTLSAKIKRGDLILAINGEPVSQLIAERKQYTSSSNEARRNYDLSLMLLKTHDKNERLKIKHGDQTFTIDIPSVLASKLDWRPLINYTSNETGYKTVGHSIAYIYASQIWHGNLDSMISLISRKKAVIFDVRNYPGGYDFFNIFHTFLPEPKVIDFSTKIMPDNPGYFKWMPTQKIGDVNKNPYKGKVIILVDERTQSQGEYSTMALQTIPNSITIGSQTAGADGVVSPIPMGGNLSISYSGYGIYYPDKTPTQLRGVRIDIPVKKTLESVKRGKDPILEEALKYLKEKGID